MTSIKTSASIVLHWHNSDPCTVTVEPWGDEYQLNPGQTITLHFEGYRSFRISQVTAPGLKLPPEGRSGEAGRAEFAAIGDTLTDFLWALA